MPGASHGMFRTHQKLINAAVRNFLPQLAATGDYWQGGLSALQPVASPVLLDKCVEQRSDRMRLEEIDGSHAADQRVKRLKDNAKTAKSRAKQLEAQADTVAARQDIQKSRQKLPQLQRSAVTSTIKP